MAWGWIVAAWLCMGVPTAFAQDCGGTGLNADCDGDGFTLHDDCDDNAPAVNPGRGEECADQKDNNCNGLLDEECDRSAQLGSIRGGGGCTGGSGVGGAAFVVLLPLGFFVRRRS